MSETQNQKTLERRAFWLTVGFSFLIFFAQTRSFKLLFDGLTYAAVSKNILATGDWRKLHYDPVFYPDFYQHPPLAMWMQALIYKVAGYSEPVTRVLSSLCSVFTVAFVFLFTKRFFGLASALWSSVILFTSTRFIKWGSNFYLDSILGFFALIGVCLWLYSIVDSKRLSRLHIIMSFLGGSFVTAAFMTKGVVMAGALAVVPFSLFFFPTLKNLYKFLIFALGLILPVMIWAYLGDGLDFIAKYFEISVASRAQNQNMSIHPWRNIYLYWLPWSPFFFFSIVSVFMSATMKKFSTEAKIIAILIVYSLSYPIGFSFGAVYFEHYLTPFYPVGAILAGTQLTRIRYFSKVTERGLKIGYQILLVAAIFIATVAPSFHVVKDFAPMKWVHEIQTLPDSEIKGVTKIAFTDLAGDRWYGLANILAKSDFQAIGSFDLSKTAMNDTILITSREESPHPSWKQITCFYVDGYRAYVAKNVTICERQ